MRSVVSKPNTRMPSDAPRPQGQKHVYCEKPLTHNVREAPY